MHMNGDVLHHIERLDLKLLKQPEFKQATTVEKSRLRDVALRKFSAHALCSRSSTNAAVYTGAASSDACNQVKPLKAHAQGLVLHMAGWLWQVQYHRVVRGKNKNNGMQRLVLRSMRSSAKLLPRRWTGQELDFVDTANSQLSHVSSLTS